MKKLFLAGVALVAMSSVPAIAADLPARPVYKAAPIVAAMPAWTGFYFGGNIGYSWGRSTNDFSLPTEALVAEDHQDVNGVIGGVQWGYNYQVGNWVMGLESDFQGSGQKGDTRYTTFGGIPLADILGPGAYIDASHRLTWFGTARSRLGFLVTPNVLLYGTVGVAYGHIKSDYTLNAPAAVLTAGLGYKDTKAGWTAGAGAEFGFWGNWTGKVEYLYMDFGSSETNVSFQGTPVLTIDRRLTDQIVRVGMNYRFGDFGKGPVVSRY